MLRLGFYLWDGLNFTSLKVARQPSNTTGVTFPYNADLAQCISLGHLFAVEILRIAAIGPRVNLVPITLGPGD